MLSSAVRVGSGLLLALVMAAEVAAQSPDPVLSPDPHLESAPQESPVSEEKTMRITSTAFEHEGDIPERYTCDGIDVSPPLSIDDIPTGTVSLALLVDDPDAPAGTWDHWVEYDIEPVAEIAEDVEALGTPGTNSWGRTGYGGPCPPNGTHRYVFKVLALDVELGWEPGADKLTVIEAIHEHVLAEATLLGFYERP